MKAPTRGRRAGSCSSTAENEAISGYPRSRSTSSARSASPPTLPGRRSRGRRGARAVDAMPQSETPGRPGRRLGAIGVQPVADVDGRGDAALGDEDVAGVVASGRRPRRARRATRCRLQSERRGAERLAGVATTASRPALRGAPRRTDGDCGDRPAVGIRHRRARRRRAPREASGCARGRARSSCAVVIGTWEPTTTSSPAVRRRARARSRAPRRRRGRWRRSGAQRTIMRRPGGSGRRAGPRRSVCEVSSSSRIGDDDGAGRLAAASLGERGRDALGAAARAHLGDARSRARRRRRRSPPERSSAQSSSRELR